MKSIQGTVVSLANEKTALVKVERSWMHPLYQKIIKRTKKYPSHYEDLDLKIGDEVIIEGCRPHSKTKHFKISGLVDKKQVVTK